MKLPLLNQQPQFQNQNSTSFINSSIPNNQEGDDAGISQNLVAGKLGFSDQNSNFDAQNSSQDLQNEENAGNTSSPKVIAASDNENAHSISINSINLLEGDVLS